MKLIRGPDPPAVCKFPRVSEARSSTGHTQPDLPASQVRITRQFLQHLFCWPSLVRDTHEYVTACLVCAQNKVPNTRPAGLIRPLPTPKRPWSHIALDFVTGLPPSSGNTTILTIIDRFSRLVHFGLLSMSPNKYL